MTVKDSFGAAIHQKIEVTPISPTEIQRCGGSGPWWRERCKGGRRCIVLVDKSQGLADSS